MTRAAVALGSNLGDRLFYLRFGAAGLTELGDVVGVSSLYETAPIGGPDQEAFFNAVIVIDTGLDPRELLDELHRIEAEAGRVREVRWGPRRLDLDLILYGDRRAEGGGMVVPHPRFAERRFVLEPLVEAWPEARTPDGQRVAALLVGVVDQAVVARGAWWLPEEEAGPAVEPAGGDSTDAPSTFTGRGGWWVVAQAVVGVAVLAAVLAFSDTMDGGGWVRWAGAVAAVAGAVQATLGLLHLGVSLTPYPEPHALGNLVHGGIYRHVRHPVYGGISLGMIGLALYQRSWPGLLVAVGGAIFFWMKAGFEERRLQVRYPDYAGYRERTRARMIAGII